MSEKSTRPNNPKPVTQITGNIFTDTSPNNQPDNTFRFVLNGVYNSLEGDIGFTTNEVGYKNFEQIPNGYTIVGDIPLLNDEVILFLAPTLPSNPSRIVKHDINGNLTDLVVDVNLNFQSDKYIQGKWRLLNLCEVVIYFVDGINTDKSININRLEQYTVNNVDNITANNHPSFEGWNTDLFNLEQGYSHPKIKLKKVNPTGGRVKLGSYHFAIQYVNANQDVSNYIAFSQGVLVSQLNNDYNLIQGGDPLFTDIRASIDIAIEDLDTRYEQFNIIVIETTEGISEPYKVATLQTQNGTINYTFRGLSEDSIPLSLIDIAVDKVPYDRSETLEISNKRLFRGNLKEKDYVWGKFQQAANNIQTKYFTRAIEHSVVENNYSGESDARMTFDLKGYMRDEIYALGVVWVFKNGSTSPVFHIPGRAKSQIVNNVTLPSLEVDKAVNFQPEDLRAHNRYPTIVGGFPQNILPSTWDSKLISEINIANGNLNNEFKNDGLAIDGATERWQVYNTALNTWNVIDDVNGGSFPNQSRLNTLRNSIITNNWMERDSTNLVGNVFSTGFLAYWESDLDYPNVECDGQRVFPEGKIRHHKMPDTTLEPHFYNIWDNMFILPLGLDFYNINPPQEYEDDIAGFYIVRAERTEDNKTVLDKGIIYHNVAHFYEVQNNSSNESPIKMLLNTNSDGVGMKFELSVPNNFEAEPYAFHTQTCLGNRHWFGVNSSLRNAPIGPVPIYAAPVLVSSDWTTLSSQNTEFKNGNLFGVNNGDCLIMNISEITGGNDAEQVIDVYNISFHSPLNKFDKLPLGNNYIKAEGILKGTWRGANDRGNRGVWVRRQDGNNNFKTKMMSHHIIDYNNWQSFTYNNILPNSTNRFAINTNYLIQNEFYIQPHQVRPTNLKSYYQREFNNAFNNTELTCRFLNRQQQESLVYGLDEKNPMPYIEQANYWTLINDGEAGGPLDGTSAAYSHIIMGNVDKNEAPPTRNHSYCIYGSAKINNTNCYGNIESISYIPTSPMFKWTGTIPDYQSYPNTAVPYKLSSVKVFGGDTFISKFAFLRNYINRLEVQTDYEHLWKDIPYFFVESTINTELRHEQIDESLVDIALFTPQNTFFPLRSEKDFLRNWDFLRWTDKSWDTAKYTAINDVIEEYINNNYVKNFYEYNRDYSQESLFKFYFPISNNLRYCGNCFNSYPHRVVYSLEGNQEQSIDYFRNFLALNYKDIESTQGPITNLFHYNDSLFAHTTHGLFVQQTKPFQLDLNNQDSVFVGVGDVFSIPEKGLKNTQNGYAGSQFKQATKITEHGVLFPSNINGQLFKLDGEGLKEITLQGNMNWGRNSIPIQFLNQYKKLTGNTYPHQGTLDANSVGTISTYDSRNKRWVLTKRDFKILDENNFNPENIDFSDESKYQNLSWTISVNAMDNGIKSFHSYIPNYLYNTTTQFYSHYQVPVLGVNRIIYKHNEGNRLRPFIVETVSKFDSLSTFSSTPISYIADSYKYDNNYEDFVIDNNDTFTQAIFYNNHQSSGLLNLEIKSQSFQTPSNNQSVLVNKRERTWNLNGFRNNVVDEDIPLFSKNWNDIQGNYFIDKVVNPLAIDYNKGLFNKDKMRDKFLIQRFIYNNRNKLVYKFNLDKSKVSF